MNSLVRFAFILFLFWLALSAIYGISASLRNDLLDFCLSRPMLEQHDQNILHHTLCTTYDFFYKWWWLLFLSVPPLAALAATLAFRRSAA